MFEELEKKENPSKENINSQEDEMGNQDESRLQEKEELAVEDIFSDNEKNSNVLELEKAFYNEGKEKPSVFEKTTANNSSGNEEGGAFLLKKIMVFILILATLIFLVGGAYMAYLYFFDTEKELNQVETEISNEEIENVVQENALEEIVPEESQPAENEESPIGEGGENSPEEELLKNMDTDGDGFTDWDEIYIYKTNPLSPDTDSDGLTDYEEIIKFGTDPLNPDTDGDGYSDGDEVQAGYNPLGEGRIYDDNKQINE